MKHLKIKGEICAIVSEHTSALTIVCFALKTEALQCSETLVDIYQSKRLHVPGDMSL